MATIQDLREHLAELAAEFGTTAQIAYVHVSQTQLSVARHYGGAKIEGHQFIYNPVEDTLIREDVFKWIADKKNPKPAKKPRKPRKPKF
jgi:hypothetical protein